MSTTSLGQAAAAEERQCACEHRDCRDEPAATTGVPLGRDGNWLATARTIALLAWISVLYAAAEGAAAITAAALAGSVALLGFGLDSAVEAIASVIVAWRFTGVRMLSETAETRAHRAVAITFFLLAPCVALDAIASLATARHAGISLLGTGLAVASLIAIPILGTFKRRLGVRIDSSATTGDGNQSLLCAFLAGAVLVSLLANALFAVWWLDPLVGLLASCLAVREGMNAWRGRHCAC